MNRRDFIAAAGVTPLGSQLGRGQARAAKRLINPDGAVLQAPPDPNDWPAFRASLLEWRARAREQLHDQVAPSARPELEWVSRCYACCFVMLCDLAFYDSAKGEYSVDGFLDRGEREFGGYDAMVLWQAYPRIGIDSRNQFDFYRDMPGGLDGLRRVTQRLHERKVKVFIDYNPWDTGTRREPAPDADALVEILKALDADGIFLDTLATLGADFRARLDQVRPGLVLEGENALPIDSVHQYLMSWAQWFPDSFVPGVLRNKWFERRHMQHQIARWDRDHTAELHRAWMNGSGMMIWENVFGSWVGWSQRDRSILRAMLPVQRRYSALFSGESWTPLVPCDKPGVFASLWEGAGLRLWTVVNRNNTAVEGVIIRAEARQGEEYFDLIRGKRIESSALSGAIVPRGAGAFLAGRPGNLGSDFPRFLAAQRTLNGRASSDRTFPALKVRIESVRATARLQAVPPAMTEVRPIRTRLRTFFRIRECGFYESQTEISLTYPSLHQMIWIEREVALEPYAIDLTPVTNRQFAEFLSRSGYQPRHRENFLKHWDKGAPPPDKLDHPVVYVSLEDARAYARWANKRLLTEEEWQYAAAGPDQLAFPWGQSMQSNLCNGSGADTTAVMKFPGGRSPFGCYDMCGNTWELTESVRVDGRTRFSILKGGSFYKAEGSEWYTDGGALPNAYALKFLLMWPGLDRCATIGFRCGADLA